MCIQQALTLLHQPLFLVKLLLCFWWLWRRKLKKWRITLQSVWSTKTHTDVNATDDNRHTCQTTCKWSPTVSPGQKSLWLQSKVSLSSLSYRSLNEVVLYQSSRHYYFTFFNQITSTILAVSQSKHKVPALNEYTLSVKSKGWLLSALSVKIMLLHASPNVFLSQRKKIK